MYKTHPLTHKWRVGLLLSRVIRLPDSNCLSVFLCSHFPKLYLVFSFPVSGVQSCVKIDRYWTRWNGWSFHFSPKAPSPGKTMPAITKVKLIVRMHLCRIGTADNFLRFCVPTARRQVHYFSIRAKTFPARWAVPLPSERRLKSNHEVGGSCRMSWAGALSDFPYTWHPLKLKMLQYRFFLLHFASLARTSFHFCQLYFCHRLSDKRVSFIPFLFERTLCECVLAQALEAKIEEQEGT